jgi:hypothetical protein
MSSLGNVIKEGGVNTPHRKLPANHLARCLRPAQVTIWGAYRKGALSRMSISPGVRLLNRPTRDRKIRSRSFSSPRMMGALLKGKHRDVRGPVDRRVSCAAKNGNGFSALGETSAILAVSRRNRCRREPNSGFSPGNHLKLRGSAADRDNL